MTLQLHVKDNQKRKWLALSITTIVAIMLTVVVQLVPITKPIAFGFTFDFLLTVPLLYLWLIRKTNIPAVTAVPLSLLMLLLVSWLLPPDQLQFVQLYKQYALPLVEMVVLGLLITKIWRSRKVYKAAGAAVDLYNRLQLASNELMPASRRATAILATELGMFMYALKAFAKPRQPGYTYHRETALGAIMGALMLIVVVETVAVHLLLMQWSVVAANIMSLLSVYSLVYLLAIPSAARHRPHQITGDRILVRFGLQETLIPFERLLSLEPLKGDVPEEKQLVKLGFMGNFNLLLRVKEPQLVEGMYGIKRSYKTLAFWADDPQELMVACKAAGSTSKV